MPFALVGPEPDGKGVTTRHGLESPTTANAASQQHGQSGRQYSGRGNRKVVGTSLRCAARLLDACQGL